MKSEKKILKRIISLEDYLVGRMIDSRRQYVSIVATAIER
jgi:hypothetical protein